MVISSACVHCAQVGVECTCEATGNPRRVVCDECTRMKEKCVWPEVVMGSSGTGKGKVVETSLRAGEKKKRQRKVTVKKAAADDDDDDVELVEGPSKAGPSKKAGPKPTGREGPVEERLDRVVNALGDLTTVVRGLAANHVVLTRQTRTLVNVAFEYVSRTYEEYTSESEGLEEFDEDVETLRVENQDLGNLDTLAARGENAKAIIAHYEDRLAGTGPASDAPKDA